MNKEKFKLGIYKIQNNNKFIVVLKNKGIYLYNYKINRGLKNE